MITKIIVAKNPNSQRFPFLVHTETCGVRDGGLSAANQSDVDYFIAMLKKTYGNVPVEYEQNA